MYAYIKGILVSKSPEVVVLENSGIGYEFSIGASTYADLPALGEEVLLYTYHYLREDAENLYGFTTEEEKEVFEALISVSGIGSVKAIGILSNISAPELVSGILRKDKKVLSSVRGIGKKTAERIIFDLQDKVSSLTVSTHAAPITSDVDDAVSALVALGWKEMEARRMASTAAGRLPPDCGVDIIIKEALKKG